MQSGSDAEALEFFTFPFFLRSTLLEDPPLLPPPVPRLPILAKTNMVLTVRNRVDLGLQHPLGYFIGLQWCIV